eukprot:g2197.t2
MSYFLKQVLPYYCTTACRDMRLAHAKGNSKDPAKTEPLRNIISHANILQERIISSWRENSGEALVPMLDLLPVIGGEASRGKFCVANMPFGHTAKPRFHYTEFEESNQAYPQELPRPKTQPPRPGTRLLGKMRSPLVQIKEDFRSITSLTSFHRLCKEGQVVYVREVCEPQGLGGKFKDNTLKSLQFSRLLRLYSMAMSQTAGSSFAPGTTGMGSFAGSAGTTGMPRRQQAGVVEMLEYVKSLNIDPIREADMLWIAEDAFNAPLPPGWTEHQDEQCRVYFHNGSTGESTWKHPIDDLFREIVDYQRRVVEVGGFWQIEDEIAEQEENIRKDLADWMELFSEDGEKFFYNKHTEESRFDDPRMAVYHRRIKMVARMKERFPILARQPRPEEPTEAEKDLLRSCVLKIQTWGRVLLAKKRLQVAREQAIVQKGPQPLRGMLRLRMERIGSGGARQLVLSQTTPAKRHRAATKIQVCLAQDSSLQLLLEGEITGEDGVYNERTGKRKWGTSTYKVYEALAGLQEEEEAVKPYLLVWLHGMDNGSIEPGYLTTIQKRLRHRVIFVVPMSPQTYEGMHFNWGCAFSKRDNKKQLGFVHGKLHEPYLTALTSKISDLAYEFDAERVLVMGYSMGGFGAFQLGGFAPDAFDVVMSVAGYGLGTLEPEDAMYGAPQPASSAIFEDFLTGVVSELSRVPIVLAVHAQKDSMSSFRDVKAIIQSCQETLAMRGVPHTAELLEVEDRWADSDRNRKKKKISGHHYFNFSLLDESSEDFLWSKLRKYLSQAPLRLEVRPLQIDQLMEVEPGVRFKCPSCNGPSRPTGGPEGLS